MLKDIENFYHLKEEPVRSCLLALRAIILNKSPEITEAWKYKLPFFSFRGKMFCYLWVQRATGHPYIGIVEGIRIQHPLLIQEKRARMKILLLNPDEDIPVATIDQILNEAIKLYTDGVVKIK